METAEGGSESCPLFFAHREVVMRSYWLRSLRLHQGDRAAQMPPTSLKPNNLTRSLGTLKRK
jgi:hypothetical protein